MSNSSDFKPGEIVDITIKGARVDGVAPDLNLLAVDLTPQISPGSVQALDLPLADNVTVERAAPAEWPPRAGDLWRSTRGNIWFVAEKQRMIPAGGGRAETPTIVLGTFGPLTLVHREDEQDGGDR